MRLSIRKREANKEPGESIDQASVETGEAYHGCRARLVTIDCLVRVNRQHHQILQSEFGAAAAAAAMFTLFYGAFFLRSLLSGNYIAPSDSLDFGVAAYLSPPALWTDTIWSGYPVAADPQALMWYPLLRLFRALGVHWNIFLLSAYVIASTTCFMLVRRLTRSAVAGTFSGIVCGFNALTIGYITNFNQIHAFAWVPLVLYGIQLIREDRYRAGAAVAAAGTAMMWLAGHPQVPVYATYLAAAFSAGGVILDRPPLRTGARRLLWSAIALALGLALAAVTLVPMIELSEYSPRATSSFALYSSSALPARELLTLVAPFVFGGFWLPPNGVPYVGSTGDSGYVGVLALALAIGAPFALRQHRRDARLWMTLALIEALLSLGPATPLGTLFFYAPGFSGFQAPLRHLFLVSLCVAITSGLSLAELTGGRAPLSQTVTATVTAVVAFGVLGVVGLRWHAPDIHALFERQPNYAAWAFAWPLVPGAALLLIALIAGRFSGRHRSIPAAVAMVLIACETGDLAMVHYRLPGRRFEYADIVPMETMLHPAMAALRPELKRDGDRVLATDGSKNPFLLPNLTRVWDLPAASGTGSLAINDYLDVLSMDTSGAVSRASLTDAHHGADLFGVRYTLVRQNSDMAADLQRQNGAWQAVRDLRYYDSDPDTFYTLFRNLRTFPRAWCVPRLVRVTIAEALDAIRADHLPGGGRFDPRQQALLESDLPVGWHDDMSATDAARVAVDTATRDRQFIVETDRPCLLVIGDVYYPWWRAALDESPVQVHRTNHAMIGIVVPPGSHVVRLWMLPLSVWIGAAVSVASLIAVAALII